MTRPARAWTICRNDGLGDAVGTDEVDVDCCPPYVLVAVPGERPLADDPGVVDQDVDPAHTPVGLRDGGGDVLAGGDVGLHRDDLGGRRALVDLGRGVRDGGVDIHCGNVRARAGERLDDGPADPLVPAGDEGGLAAQRRVSHRRCSFTSLRLILPMTVLGRRSRRGHFSGTCSRPGSGGSVR